MSTPLTLLTFAASAEDPSLSPFCCKAICLLQLSGQSWQRKDVLNPSKAPHGRLPVLLAGQEVIADSSVIQTWLEARGADFEAGLSPADKAVAHAMKVMVEENLRQTLVHDRWLRDDCWAHMRPVFFAGLPVPLQAIVPGLARKKVRKSLITHGIAQFDEATRLARAGRDLQALSTQLADKPFLMAAHPTTPDCIAVPVLNMIRHLPCDTGLRRLVREDAGLMAYTDRGVAAMYP